jgi:hypothetical protein
MQESSCLSQELSVDTQYAMIRPDKSGLCSGMLQTHTTTATTMTAASRKGPLTPEIRPQVPQQCIEQMGDILPSKWI